MQSLLRLDPRAHFEALDEHNKIVRRVETAKEVSKGSIAKKTAMSCFQGDEFRTEARRDVVRESMRNSVTKYDELNKRQVKVSARDLHRAAFRATRSIYGVIPLAMLPVFGVSLLALSISWNTIPINLYYWMVDVIQALTVVFQACFVVVAFFVWDANGFFAYLDAAICFITPFADWYWIQRYKLHGVLNATELTLFCLLTGYQTARVWTMTVRPRHCSWMNSYNSHVNALERLQVHWVTRSASLVSEILPEIEDTWGQLVDLWGYEFAAQVCRISIYVTDPDHQQVALLKHEIQDTHLYRHGCLFTGRPDLKELVQDHTLEMICTRRNSYSLLAFCGSPQLASELHQTKISNDMLTSITGNKNHQMEFVSESYGGQKKRVAKTDSRVSSQSVLAADISPDDGEVRPFEHMLQRQSSEVSC